MVYWQNLAIVSRESTKIFCRTCTFVWCINKCYCHDGGIKLLMWRKNKRIERQECPDSLLSALVLLTRNWYRNIFLLTPLSEANNCASPSNYLLKHAFQNYAGSCIYKPKNFFLLHLRVIVEIINQSKAAHFPDFVETSFYTACISFQIHSGHLGVNLV